MAESIVPPSGGVAGTNIPNSTAVDVNDEALSQLINPITTKLIPVLYTLVFGIGLPTNVLALLTMAAKSKKPSTIFLINLATADLLLILMLPFKISYHLLGNDWLFGEGLCRTMTAFFYGNMYCSILLLTFISIDRYFALVHPFFSKRFRDNRFALSVCAVIWVTVVLFVWPFFSVKQSFRIKGLNITTCYDVYLKNNQVVYFYYWLIFVILGFFIPSLVTISCYSLIIRSLTVNDIKYKKSAKITLLILFVYLVCFTPSNIMLLVHQWVPDLHKHYIFLLCLSSFNSCFDPFLYYYISEDCRNRVKRIICFQKVDTSLNLQPSTRLTHTPITNSLCSSSVI
ncbi:proteinase-activated receptor 3-like [Carcharodon carcharias]|uniref:proteinase-activated receptor 3-like n=1 Tax=Carcharodon carcharias TaxID=13397 RepID=UPI001B7DAF90|nr:proteinase-activated receptor 3-like [Carcharodon carcharias]